MIYNVLFVLAGFFADTILSLFFPLDPGMRTIVWVPSLGFLSFVLTIRKGSLGEAMAMAMLLGFFVDVLQYRQPVTVIVFPLVVFAVKNWSEHLNESAVEVIFIGLVALFLLELGLYAWFLAIGVTRLTPELWFAKRVFLTLILHIPLLGGWLWVHRLKNALVAHAEANRRFQETGLWRAGQKR